MTTAAEVHQLVQKAEILAGDSRLSPKERLTIRNALTILLLALVFLLTACDGTSAGAPGATDLDPASEVIHDARNTVETNWEEWGKNAATAQTEARVEHAANLEGAVNRCMGALDMLEANGQLPAPRGYLTFVVYFGGSLGWQPREINYDNLERTLRDTFGMNPMVVALYLSGEGHYRKVEVNDAQHTIADVHETSAIFTDDPGLISASAGDLAKALAKNGIPVICVP